MLTQKKCDRLNFMDRETLKKMSKTKKIVISVFLTFIFLCVCLMTFLHSKLNRINRVDTSDIDMVSPEDETFETDGSLAQEGTKTDEVDVFWNNVDMDIMRDENVHNILLIGQDRRSGEGRQRSDAMIICSINKNNGKLILTSLMRDMYVPIPGYSDNRINAAYQLGGMPLLNQVILECFGIEIDGNIEVDFDGFVEALSYVGNLKIELSANEVTYLNKMKNWKFKEGVNELTPEQALAYSRMRYTGNSDWERTDRQRRVIMAALDNVKGMKFMELVTLADQILPCITTDMSNSEIFGYIYTVVVHRITGTESHRIPVQDTYTMETIKNMKVLVPDLAENSRYLKLYIYGR